VLPFTKRPNRPEDSEVIDSGEIEVVRVAPSVPPASMKVSSRYPAPPSDRPRVFERPIEQEEEMTTVMPSKRGSSFPPASASAPRSSARPAPSRRARAEDDESTMLRSGPSSYPGGGPSSNRGPGPASRRPPASFVPPPPPSPQVYANNGLIIATPPTVLGSEEIPESIRAQAMAALPQMPAFARPYMPPPPSTPIPLPPDSRMDPPATVITTRTRVLIGRPTVSWAAALVAMGIFVGLVTAVVARGDADSLIDATASFVDPAHSTAKAAAATPTPAPVPPPAAITPPLTPPTPAPPPAAIPVTDIKDVPKAAQNDTPAAAAPAPAPKAPVYVAPRPRPAPVVRAIPRPQPKVDKPDPPEPKKDKDDAVAAAPPPKPEKPAKASKRAAAAAAASDDDNNAAAAAADKLAREQLEAVLK
jgi:hypothetical protein